MTTLRPRAGRRATSGSRRRYVAGLAALVMVLTGCGGSDEDDTLQVLAASSLTDVLTDLAATFEAEHEGVEVDLSFGSSTDLAEQAADGAPGDVLATADEASMQIAADAGAVAGHEAFATNVLVLVTPPDNPAGVESLDDLDGTSWVRCAEEAPCGRVATAVLDAEDVDAEPVSLEEDARSTLDKVVSGEADAALVYASDAAAAGDAVRTIEIPGAEAHRATYFIGALDQAADQDLAEQLVDLVLAAEGRQVLAAAGFGAP